MIVNGASRRSVSFWTKHLENDIKNDRAELKEIRGLAAENLHDALIEMQEDAQYTRLVNFFYQANFNPPMGPELTEEQWQRAFEIFEHHRGIPEGTARVVFEHEKEGRTHRHVLWSRVDMETGKAWPDRHDAKICHAASREIAEELGLDHAISPFDKDREGPRPERAPESWEMFRGLKSGLDPRQIKAEVTHIFRESENAFDFVNGLEQHGYHLVRGDRRDFCLIDSAGDIHSLARRIDGVKAKELRNFMKDLAPEMYPSVDQAKAHFRENRLADYVADLGTVQQEIAYEEALYRSAVKKERKEGRFIEPTAKEIRELREAEARWPILPPSPEPIQTHPQYHFANAARDMTRDRNYESPKELRGMSAILVNIYEKSKEGYKLSDLDEYNQLMPFNETLDRRGIGFARTTKEEAERSQREARFAQAVGNYAPRFAEGEIVAVRAWNKLERRDGQIVQPGQKVYKIDQKVAGRFVDMLGVEKSLSGIDSTKISVAERFDIRSHDESRKWQDIKFKSASKRRGAAQNMGEKGVFASVGLGKTTGRLIGKSFDTVADMFESILAPALEGLGQSSTKAEGREEVDASHYVNLSQYTNAQAPVEQSNERQGEDRGPVQRNAGRER